MPRVTHVKSARKDNPVCKKGESYFWWKFRYGGKRYSLTRPKQSQLTQSAYFSTLYGMSESITEYELADADDWETLKEDISMQLQDLQSETQDSLDNMPDSLQYSPTGELLQERIDALDSAVSDVECLDDPEEYEEEDFTREPFDDDEEFESDEDRDVAEADHEHEQDELESDHAQDQQEEREAAFDTWKIEAKDNMIEAIDQAVV